MTNERNADREREMYSGNCSYCYDEAEISPIGVYPGYPTDLLCEECPKKVGTNEINTQGIGKLKRSS